MNQEDIQALISLAALRFNEEITGPHHPSKGILHPTHNTLLERDHFKDQEIIRVHFHGFTLQYLTEESRKILGFAEGERKTAGFHNHEFYEFIFLYKGNMKQHVMTMDPHAEIPALQETVHELRPHQLMMMNSNTIHYPQPEADDIVLFNIMMRRKAVENLFVTQVPFNASFADFFLESLYGEKGKQDFLLFDLTEEMEDTLFQIIQEYYAGDVCSQQILYAKIILLFTQLAEQDNRCRLNSGVLRGKDTLSEEEFVLKLMDYLKQHYKDASLEDLSRVFGYSKYHLSRLIRQNTGLGLKELLTHYKMVHARNYLEFTELSISEIASGVGYYDESHFSKAFRNTYKMSPVNYRQNVRRQD